MYTAPTRQQAREDAEAPFMWFKTTGDEVGAPPERRGEVAARKITRLTGAASRRKRPLTTTTWPKG